MMGGGREGEDTLHDGGWGGGRGDPTVKSTMWPLATCWLCLCESSQVGIILF